MPRQETGAQKSVVSRTKKKKKKTQIFLLACSATGRVNARKEELGRRIALVIQAFQKAIIPSQ
jgi:hypothetical protein